jgi:2Fe-2S ferredoxin
MPKVTFIIDGESQTVEFQHGELPYSHHGKPESFLDVAKNFDISLEHACGGSCACTTCHVVVTQGASFLSPAEENEDDMLDRAPGLTPTSRLGCQAVIRDPDAEVHVRVPRHTINLISGHGS